MTISPSSSSTPSAANTCEVSNDLVLPTSPSTPAQTGWEGDILVLCDCISSNSGTALPFQQGDLSLLCFSQQGSNANVQSASTSNVLPINMVGTLNLPSCDETGASALNNAYSLLVCQANNCFPVVGYGEVVAANGAYPAITVPGPSPCNSSSAANAYVLLQNLMAFPASPLAQQFTAALNAATGASSSEAVSTAVDSFFASTAEYQNVNFDVLLAVMAYAQASSYVWANFQNSFTYTIYTTNTNSTSSGSAGSDDVTVADTVTTLGTVVFTLTNSAPTTLAEAMAAYAITWNPTGQNAISLTLSDGQLLAPSSAGFSGICLQCSFMDPAALTANAADGGTPIQVLTGLINGIRVLGSPFELNDNEKARISGGLSGSMASKAPLATSAADHLNTAKNGGLTAFMESKTYKSLELFNHISAGIKVMTKLVCWIKGQFINNSPPTQEEINAKETSLQNEANTQLENAGNDNAVSTGEQLSETQVQAESTTLNAEAELEEAGEIAVQASLEKAQLNVSNNSAIQTEYSATLNAASELKDINPANASASEELDPIQANLTSNQAAIDSEDQTLDLSSKNAIIHQQDAETKLGNAEDSNQTTETENEDDDYDSDASDL